MLLGEVQNLCLTAISTSDHASRKFADMNHIHWLMDKQKASGSEYVTTTKTKINEYSGLVIARTS